MCAPSSPSSSLTSFLHLLDADEEDAALMRREDGAGLEQEGAVAENQLLDLGRVLLEEGIEFGLGEVFLAHELEEFVAHLAKDFALSAVLLHRAKGDAGEFTSLGVGDLHLLDQLAELHEVNELVSMPVGKRCGGPDQGDGTDEEEESFATAAATIREERTIATSTALVALELLVVRRRVLWGLISAIRRRWIRAIRRRRSIVSVRWWWNLLLVCSVLGIIIRIRCLGCRSLGCLGCLGLPCGVLGLTHDKISLQRVMSLFALGRSALAFLLATTPSMQEQCEGSLWAFFGNL